MDKPSERQSEEKWQAVRTPWEDLRRHLYHQIDLLQAQLDALPKEPTDERP